MLNVIVLSVTFYLLLCCCVIMLSVLMLKVAMVSVVAPLCTLNKLVNITFKITHNVIYRNQTQ
jgi:hypothetical protein